LTSAKFGAIVMTGLLGVYLTLVWERSIALVNSPQPIAVAIGSLMLFLPVVAAWGIFLELRFGLRIEKLGEILKKENAWPRFEFELRPSGRPTRESAEAIFGKYQKLVENDESNWRVWFALGLAYDAAGDRARARKAMRSAIALSRNSLTL
jgi:tetratricopeptide (TPR) repeat protein